MTGAGRVREQTVLSCADRLTRHERQHMNQLERLVDTASV